MIRKYQPATLYSLSHVTDSYNQPCETYTPVTGAVDVALTHISGTSTTINGVFTVSYSTIGYTKDMRPQKGDKLVVGTHEYVIDSIIENPRYRQLTFKEDSAYES